MHAQKQRLLKLTYNSLVPGRKARMHMRHILNSIISVNSWWTRDKDGICNVVMDSLLFFIYLFIFGGRGYKVWWGGKKDQAEPCQSIPESLRQYGDYLLTEWSFCSSVATNRPPHLHSTIIPPPIVTIKHSSNYNVCPIGRRPTIQQEITSSDCHWFDLTRSWIWFVY